MVETESNREIKEMAKTNPVYQQEERKQQARAARKGGHDGYSDIEEEESSSGSHSQKGMGISEEEMKAAAKEAAEDAAEI